MQSCQNRDPFEPAAHRPVGGARFQNINKKFCPTFVNPLCSVLSITISPALHDHHPLLIPLFTLSRFSYPLLGHFFERSDNVCIDDTATRVCATTLDSST